MTYFEREARARRAQGHSIADIAVALQCSETKIENALLGVKVVRIVHTLNDLIYLFQCLPGECHLQMHRMSDGTICFDVLPPKNEDSQEWAERQVKDLAGDKGFNAVVAPRWHDA